MNDLEAIKRACKLATPGPWHFTVSTKRLRDGGRSKTRAMIGAVAPGHCIVTDHPGGTSPSFDGEFIAMAREAVPALIAEVEWMRGHRYIRSAERDGERIRALNAEVERLRADLTDRLEKACQDREIVATEVIQLRADLAYEKQLHKDASGEVERLRNLLRDIAASGVQLDAGPPGLPYATVMIDAKLWAELRKEFGK